MLSVNKAIIVGNLGKDPELKYATTGQAILTFSVATGRKWKDKDGVDQERTEWHNITAFGKLAETCNQFLQKGTPVYVEGRIQTDTYDDTEGIKRRATKIIASVISVLSKSTKTSDEGTPSKKEEEIEETKEPLEEEEKLPF